MPTSSSSRAEAGWRTLSREVHFENANLTVATEEVCTPAREDARPWTTVHRKAAVVIAPVMADGQMVLVRQERIPVRSTIWEVPAGQVDESAALDDDELAAVALRELREETGYQLAPGGQFISIGTFFSSPGFTDECAHFFLAHPVEVSAEGHAHDQSESIVDCRSFSACELSRMIGQNEIRDANTLSICAKLIARGFLALPVSP